MEKYKKVFLLELNEFNYDLLKQCSYIFELKNLQKILSYQKIKTFTQDTYESDFLEPWVQWVSIHTGTSSQEHKIKHLGDVPDLNKKQIWQELGMRNYTSAIWGAMNAARGSEDRCLVFLPDPWTFSESAFPSELEGLLNPIRAVAKNYGQRSIKNIWKGMKGFIGVFNKNGMIKDLVFTIFKMIKYSFSFPGEHFPFIALLEQLSVNLFLNYKNTKKPDFSILFVNTLAHIQHHHWKDFDYANNKKLFFGLKILDQILENILNSLESDEVLMVANGLSQKNTQEEKPWILYRQVDHKEFLKKIGIECEKIEPHMTHDAHLFFSNTENKKKALNILSAVYIEGKKLFECESYNDDPLKLFYKIVFTDEIGDGVKLYFENGNVRFSDYFKTVVKRTGKHIQEGVLLSSEAFKMNTIANHEIYDCILQFFPVKN